MSTDPYSPMDPVLYQNFFMLLKIICTLLVISLDCERSASIMRRLNSSMRAIAVTDGINSHDRYGNKLGLCRRHLRHTAPNETWVGQFTEIGNFTAG